MSCLPSGYGSQALALKYLGVPFEHWKICEWAIKSIQAYKDIHFTNESAILVGLNKEQEIERLYKQGISSNYNEPMAKEQINRLSLEQIYRITENNLLTHNLVNIQQVKGKDLQIIDTDKYEYIMTYSFPCQDLSLAGKGKGMSDTSTRSGMLWEVERILTECKKLGTMPQVLLMENVPQVHSVDNMPDFHKWQVRLEELGYKSYWQDLIATDYGIPQTRNRCFMVSILGDYSYTFPQPIPLKLKLKDMLEDNVDEKYYLSDKMIDFFTHNEKKQKEKGNGFSFNVSDGNVIAKTITTRAGSRMDDNFISNKSLQETLENNEIKEEISYIDAYNRKIRDDNLSSTISTRVDASNNTYIAIKNATKKCYLEATDGDGIDISSRMEHHRGTVQKDKAQTLTTQCDRGVVVNDNNIYNLFFTIFDLCCIIDTKEKDKYERSRELLQILWEEIGKKEIWQEIRRFISIQEKKILQSNLYENELYEDRKSQSKISTSTPNSSEYNESVTNREKMFNMWKNWKTGYTPQRWELSEQQFRQFNLFMQELSYETTQEETSMQDMWQTNERFRILQQTLFKIQEIWRSNENKISNGLRIRKLTPREAFRLMGVKDEDFDKVKKNQSDASLYHLAGDSIVVNVLMAIFKELLESKGE